MAELKYIPFYPGYMEDTSDLSDSEFRRLMYALVAFCNGEEPPEPLTGKEVIAYRFITRNIRAAQEQYNAKCKANSENAKKRTQANVSDRQRTLTNDSETSQNKEQRTKTNIIPPTPLAGGEGVSSRFVPPTPQEVTAYCQQRQNGIDGSEFCDFYASKGWMIGKSKMKDWRAAVRTWEKSRQKQPAAPKEDEWKGWH